MTAEELDFIPTGLHPVGNEFEITSDFGEINRRLRGGKPHKGVDFKTPIGTPCVAFRNGIVQMAGDGKEFGNRVWIYCDNLSLKFAFRVLYAHLNTIMVKEGEKVKEGQLIGFTGDTGVKIDPKSGLEVPSVTGPHLHFEVRILPADKAVRPRFYDLPLKY
jgi:murein DD-endopeptidase MepM/ murein hydrolase activator NlpD